MLMIQRRASGGIKLPSGSCVMWFGNAGDLPGGWAVDGYLKGYFVQGAPVGGASNTAAGGGSHAHTNPSASGSAGAHTHSLSGNRSSAPSATSIRYYYSGTTRYVASAAHTHYFPTGKITGSAGGHTHALSSTGSTSPVPSFLRLYYIKASKDMEFPVQGVTIWDDLAGNIPEGFAICNGTNGTPDLRNRFVYGASVDSDVGNTGGTTTHSHTNSAPGAGGSHAHSYSYQSNTASGAEKQIDTSSYTSPPTTHRHTVSGTTATQANHSHTLGTTGGANHLPQYLMLYYIMRIE